MIFYFKNYFVFIKCMMLRRVYVYFKVLYDIVYDLYESNVCLICLFFCYLVV